MLVGAAGATELNAQQVNNKAPNIDPSIVATSAETETIARIAVARQLIQIGLKDKDPLPLIVAAKIFRQLPPFKGAPPKKLGTSDKQEPFVESMSEVFSNSVDGILKRARDYAKGQADLVALIDDVAGMSSRGAGGIIYVDSVPMKAATVYEITFEGKKRAAIYIESQEEDGSIGLIIRDAGKNSICEDRRGGPLAYCEWTPRETGPFNIEITNSQDRKQDYVLVTN